MRRRSLNDPSFTPRALAEYREAYSLAQIRAQQNPGDLLAVDDLGSMATFLGNELVRENRFKEAEPFYLEAASCIDQLIHADPADRRHLYLKADSLSLLGTLYGHLRRRSEQAAALTQAEALSRDILKKWPGDLLVPERLGKHSSKPNPDGTRARPTGSGPRFLPAGCGGGR